MTVLYLAERMLSGRHSQALLRLRRAVGGSIALLLLASVFAATAQAGRPYVYCRAMREVMAHACCAGQKLQPSAPPVTSIGLECCQARSMPALAASTPVARAPEFSAPPPLSISLPALFELAALGGTQQRMRQSAAVRAGPQGPRVHSRIMVFLL